MGRAGKAADIHEGKVEASSLSDLRDAAEESPLFDDEGEEDLRQHLDFSNKFFWRGHAGEEAGTVDDETVSRADSLLP